MNTPAAHHHEAIQLTTDTELDKLYPCFTFNSAHISSPKQSDHLSLSAHHLFESACGQTCIVCLEDFIEQESVLRELPCHHFYHKSCIDRWLITRSLSCPLCKESIQVNQQQEVGESSTNSPS